MYLHPIHDEDALSGCHTGGVLGRGAGSEEVGVEGRESGGREGLDGIDSYTERCEYRGRDGEREGR